MTLTELRYIVAVARLRHFGKAAEACFVSQPTLSVAVRKLEEDLGVRLFERSHTDVLVTDIGALIVAQAEIVLNAADGVRELAAASRDPLGRQLTLGVIYTVGPYLVPRLISGLKLHAPKMSLVVKENFTDALAAQLKRGELDAAIMSLPYADPHLLSRPLYDEPLQVALPAGHRLAKKKRLTPADLATDTLLLLLPSFPFGSEYSLRAVPPFALPTASLAVSVADPLIPLLPIALLPMFLFCYPSLCSFSLFITSDICG